MGSGHQLAATMNINGRPGNVPQIMKLQAKNAQARDRCGPAGGTYRVASRELFAGKPT
jgi:hypothetical protein